MMKKILSLCLVVAMLLGMVAMTVSAEETTTDPAFKDVKVVLSDGIGLKFTFKNLEVDKEYTVNIVSEEWSGPLTTTANADGEASVTYNALTPAMFDMTITATLDGTEVTSGARSVMAYCNWVLNTANFKEQVYTIVVDLLNYAYAAELWKDNEAAAPTKNYFGRELTAAEETAIKTITAGSYSYATWSNITGILAKIGLTYTDPGVEKFIKLLDSYFFTDGVIKSRDTIGDKFLQTYDMIVEDSWGGSSLGEGNGNTLTENDFKVGDIVVAYMTNKPDWMFLYVGDNQFLGWCNSAKGYRGTITMDNFLNFLAGNGYSGIQYNTTDTAVTVATGAAKFYCILRASQLMPNLDPVDAPEVGDKASYGTTYLPAELTQLAATADQTSYEVQFGNSMPILWTSIGYRFYIATEEIPDGTKFYGQLAGEDEVELEVKENTNGKYVDFTYLTPADLSKIVTVVAKNAAGEEISIQKQFSGEGYAAWALENGDTKLQNLVSAMVLYSKSARNFVVYCANYMDAQEDLKDCTDFAAVQERLTQTATETTSYYGASTHEFAYWAYDKANVDVSEYITKNGSGIFWDLISKRMPNTEKAGQPLYEMMVKDLYGGTYFTDNGATAYPLSLKALQTGDILSCRYEDSQTKNNYCTMIYLGDGQFLYNYEGKTDVSIITLGDADDTATEDVNENINEYYNWYWYVVLRPSQLANQAN